MATLQPQSVVSGHTGRITALAGGSVERPPRVWSGGDDGAVLS
jgi:hypothetical protein